MNPEQRNMGKYYLMHFCLFIMEKCQSKFNTSLNVGNDIEEDNSVNIFAVK